MTAPLIGYAALAASPMVGIAIAHIRHRTVMKELARARHAAIHDTLTGLLNRAGWHAEAPRLLNRAATDGRAAAMLLADIDNLKTINDRHGHQTGDRAIAVIADQLATRVGDLGIAARLGGDEFAALLVSPVAGVQATVWASAIATRIGHRLTGAVQVDGCDIAITASVGVAPPPVGARRFIDLAEALREADSDMYAHKAHWVSANESA